uniref:Uncharacterized protein n=1 Tax=Arundo donax TaxID=35708 RepID=A0A0A8Z9M3_ARUDO
MAVSPSWPGPSPAASAFASPLRAAASRLP